MLTSYHRLLTGLIIAFLVVIAGLGIYLEESWRIHHRAGSLSKAAEFQVAQGASLHQITQKLDQQKIIEDPVGFRLIARFQGFDHRLKAGNYRFPAGVSAAKVLEMLQQGVTHLYRFTIPEGLTSQQILARIRTSKIFSGKTPQKLTEASIMPETYLIEKGSSRHDFLEKTQLKWQKVATELWNGRQESLPFKNLDEALILASIIEKEAVFDRELPIIAGVFINRLRQNMRLQSDPTVVYALSAGLGKMKRRLTRKDWKYQHDHNTYYRKGLPPTAISHPGIHALKATLHPEQHNFIFFVADGKGGHNFSVTLKQHNRAVALLRKIQKNIKKNKEKQ